MSTRPSSLETKGNEKTEICKTDQRVNPERGTIPYFTWTGMWRAWGVLLGILGAVVPPGSPGP